MNISALTPRSLFFQLALLLVLAFSMLHFLTYVTISVFTERHIIRNVLANHNAAIALCLRLLEPERQSHRDALIKSLSQLPDLTVHFDDQGPPFAQGKDRLSVFLRDHLQEMLRGAAALPTAADSLRTHVELLAPDSEGGGQPSWVDRITDRLGESLTHNFQARIALQLADGTWVDMGYVGYARGASQTVPLFVLTLESLFLACLVLFFIHRVVRPLRGLAHAADEFGATMHLAAPLPLEGPREVQRAAQAFNLMQQRIHHSMEERGRIFAALSHDLRTPLTRMRLRLERVAPEELREKLLEDILSITSIVEDSTALMQAPLRPQAEGVQPKPTDMQAFLEALVEDRRDMGAEVVLDSEVRCSARIYPVPLRRCLDNLLDNALRYGRAVHVRARVEEGGRQLVLEVLDNGPGLPEDHLEKVFEPFFRMEASRSRDTGGSGLGLAIARSMLRGQGGNVSLSNRPAKDGGGLCARVVLPLEQA